MTITRKLKGGTKEAGGS